MATSLSQNYINEIVQKTIKSTKCNSWQASTTSWTDPSRSSFEGEVSCWGSNIMDAFQIVQSSTIPRDETRATIVRSENWNELIGFWPAEDFFIIADDIDSGVQKHISLKDYASQFGKYNKHRGVHPDFSLGLPSDSNVRIRLQGCIVAENTRVIPCNYCYQNEKNVVVVSNSQGSTAKLAKRGTELFYHHKFNKSHHKITKHAILAEKSNFIDFKVQREKDEERRKAIACGKATSFAIGPSDWETFSAVLNIAFPLKCKPVLPKMFFKVKTDTMVLGSSNLRPFTDRSLKVSAARMSIDEKTCGVVADNDLADINSREREEKSVIDITYTVWAVISCDASENDIKIATIKMMETLYHKYKHLKSVGRLSDGKLPELSSKDMATIEETLMSEKHPII